MALDGPLLVGIFLEIFVYPQVGSGGAALAGFPFKSIELGEK